MSERRVDPSDGTAYTFEELAWFYKGKYKKNVIETYWEEECFPPVRDRSRQSQKQVQSEPKAKVKAKAKVNIDKSPEPKASAKREPKAKPKANAKVKAKAKSKIARRAPDPAAGSEQLKVVCARAAALGNRCYRRGDLPSLGYGTAGFRTKADVLPHVMYRMGILAALRSRLLGSVIGVMVTASHNPEGDNGVKLVNSDGSMLPIEWEALATRLANAVDDELAAVIEEVVEKAMAGVATSSGRALEGAFKTSRPRVIIGRDTRASSGALAAAVADGANVVQAFSAWPLGLTSTPQLHFVVRCQNTRPFYGKGNIEGYFDKIIQSYLDFLAAVDEQQKAPRKKYTPKVVVDCANGVGAKVMNDAAPRLAERLDIKIVKAGDGGLNEGCGSDYVKVKQSAPEGVEPLEAGQRGVSFDGDADRVVYFCNVGGKFALLDGDRIATLLLAFISAQLTKCKWQDLRVGLVQTAYANGASTAYARSQDIKEENLVCAKTGVKHLHHAALDMDVGVYFEANGHGTVIFSKEFSKQLRKAATSGNPEIEQPAKLLFHFRKIINETVGDAFSDFLAVEAALYALDMAAEDWLATYDDFPNKLMKVSVADREAFETTNAERTCVKPVGLQDKIDELVKAAGAGARSFVRPSGTEDVVRVYAEAADQAAMEDLAQKVAQAVYDLAGGVGARP